MTYSFIPSADTVFKYEIQASNQQSLARCFFEPQVVYWSIKHSFPIVCKHSLEIYTHLQTDFPEFHLQQKPLELEIDSHDFYLDKNTKGISYELDGDLLEIRDELAGVSYRILILKTVETKDSTYISDFLPL